MKTLSSIFLLNLLVFLGSCEKEKEEENESNSNTPPSSYFEYESIGTSSISEDFYNFYTSDGDAEISVQDNNIFGSTGSTFAVTAKSTNGSYSIVEIGSLDVTTTDGGSVLYHVDQTVPSGIYGQTTQVSLGSDYTDSVYIPSRIHALSTDGASIGSGSELTWNVDINNEKGVFILVSFQHSRQRDNSFNSSPEEFRMDLTDDDGTYSFPTEMFTGIPEGALIKLVVLRANYATIIHQNNVDVCKFLAYTASAATHTYSN